MIKSLPLHYPKSGLSVDLSAFAETYYKRNSKRRHVRDLPRQHVEVGYVQSYLLTLCRFFENIWHVLNITTLRVSSTSEHLQLFDNFDPVGLGLGMPLSRS